MADNQPAKPVQTDSSAKERFLTSALNVSNHRQMMEQPSFERGTDAAMIQLVSELSNEVKDQASALSVGFRIAGAVAYLKSLKTLSEKPSLPYTRTSDNLTHK